MTKNKVRRSVAALLCVACVVLLVLGGLNLPKKSNAKGEAILENLRVRMLLNVTGAGVVESYVNIAKQEAQAKAKAEGGGMKAIREAVQKAEEDTGPSMKTRNLPRALWHRRSWLPQRMLITRR